ncbi:hypothetical protein Tsubulata_004139 [Turnera subulata]|uniref:Cytochrome P450 n=1 Tax=Turnera subulata TaxID=218843 RepID=A0A9Q0F0K5_9ROSI|nr:hypothetical protein Tsubulata_004139 [Turnera subulata]
MDPLTLVHQWWQEMHRTIVFDPVFLSVLLLISLLYLLKHAKTETLNLPPSPPRLPIIGNLHQLSKPLNRCLFTLSEKYGPLMLLHLGQAPFLIVSSPEVAEKVTKTQDVAFAGRPQTRVSSVLSYGCLDVAFSPYGDYWRQARQICVVELLSQKRVQAFQLVREEEVAAMMDKIRLASAKPAVVDLSDMCLTVTSNIVSRSALGRVYGNGSGDKSFGEFSKKAVDLLTHFCFQDMLPSLGWMDNLTGLAGKLETTFRAFDKFLDQVIEEHQNAHKEDSSDAKDIVDILLRLQKDGGLDIDLTIDGLKAILMDMFVGGTDTTAAAMEWAMSELVKNPSIMKKAQEEVRRAVGKKPCPSESDLSEMVYLKCILKESMRLHSPAIIARETSESVKLEGYDIPPKTRVLINAWAFQRDPKAWDRPEEFIPERFANSSVDFRGQDSRFMPFGGGRRLCPGLSFAIVEAELVLANLLYLFNWELPDGMPAESLDMTDSKAMVHRETPLLLIPVMHSP